MFKIRSIAVRLVLAISLTVAVACGILGTFSIVQQRALTHLALDQQLKLQYDSVIAAIDYEGRAALAVSSVVAALPPVADAHCQGGSRRVGRAARRRHEGVDGAGHPADHVPEATGHGRSTASMRQKCSVTIFRHGAAPWSRRLKTGKQIVGVEPGREALSIFGMTPIMRDGKSAGQCRRRRRLRQGIRRSRQEALRHRSCGTLLRRQGFQEAVLDLRRRRGRDSR